jgi:hypothetical protein
MFIPEGNPASNDLDSEAKYHISATGLDLSLKTALAMAGPWWVNFSDDGHLAFRDGRRPLKAGRRLACRFLFKKSGKIAMKFYIRNDAGVLYSF